MGERMNSSGLNENDLEKRCRELEEALAFAEKNWKEASQANFLLDSKLKKVTDELAAKDNEIQSHYDRFLTYKNAYEAVVNSRTWKMSMKIKRLFGKKSG